LTTIRQQFVCFSEKGPVIFNMLHYLAGDNAVKSLRELVVLGEIGDDQSEPLLGRLLQFVIDALHVRGIEIDQCAFGDFRQQFLGQVEIPWPDFQEGFARLDSSHDLVSAKKVSGRVISHKKEPF
jgi:hypothetical protein